YREQLFDMLGLNPLPARSELHATVTGSIDHPEFRVEKLHFQSLPGLYVTANLYLPKNVEGPAPTILYVSGHAKVFTNGVSLGNKAAYQHHGIWFARHGYVCMVVDTLQLGEIEGIHHGTHNKGMWWWNSRGYTPAGVEAWNYMRALDYLETRPEVDKTRFGVTGRSGGGAYSWVLGAIDDRIKVAAPVAGITDLENYVVDHKVERHCDCMFHVNNFRWDYPLLAALMAPRPLLFCNTDKDEIFPLEGIVRTHAKVREIYKLYGATTNLGLLITEGPHKDTQDLQVPTFRWFNRFLKQADPLVEVPAVKLFDPTELTVFKELPRDAINARIHETFVPMASTSAANKETVKKELRERVFAGWPAPATVPVPRRIAMAGKEGLQFAIYEFETQPHVTLRAYVLKAQDQEAKQIQMRVLDEES
ncbi:MAG: alpha/beta hydrolase family protein, partial [Limisphaerales bacterium]